MTGLRTWLQRLGVALALLLAASVNTAFLMTAYHASSTTHSARQAAAPASRGASGGIVVVPGLASGSAREAPTPDAAGAVRPTTKNAQHGSPVLVAGPQFSDGLSSPAANTPETPWPALLGVLGILFLGLGGRYLTRRVRL
jgi:hypothetical protein